MNTVRCTLAVPQCGSSLAAVSCVADREPSRQAGVALAMLVWFIAAMSLLVGTIVMQARVDVKLTQLHSSRAIAEAAGDGAIQLGLAQWLSFEGEEALLAERGWSGSHRVGAVDVTVRFQPVTGLIDLNLATVELLSLLFSRVATMQENEALALAEAVVEWRTREKADDDMALDALAQGSADPRIRHGRFEAVEDLLFVPGVDRRLYEAVRDAVYVSQRGQPGVDWLTASPEILAAIGQELGEDRIAQLIAVRSEDTSGVLGPPAELDLGFQERRKLPLYRADAVMSVGQEQFLRRRWVDRRQSGPDGLPWTYYRTEAVRAATAAVSKEAENAGF